MKKMFYFVAVATFALLSCQQEEDVVNDVVKNEPITFKASIENFATRANINDAYGLVWANGDQIGIFFPNWGEKNQSFTLSNGAGTTKGEFSRDQSGEYSLSDASAAFFPKQGDNHVDEGTMYFELPKDYYSYTSGKMLTPLVANLSGNTDKILFKHAGAAVKVTIYNLPAHSHSIGMSVEGKQIQGYYHINPEKAGTDALVLNNAENTANNTVWLNYTNASESEWTFIFPVPTLTDAKFSFSIYDDNDVLVWSGKANSATLGRADILEMPALTITPYSKFQTKSGWYVHRTLDGSNWGDSEMVTDGETSIAKGLTFTSAGQFKVTDGTNWYPDNNWNVNTAGTYDVIYKHSDHSINIVSTSSYSYPNVPTP